MSPNRSRLGWFAKPVAAGSDERPRPPASGARPPRAVGLIYVGLVCVCGALAIADSIHTLWHQSVGYHWLVLAGLTWASGFFALRVPRVPAVISISETFVFILILLFSGPPAVVTIAVDGVLTSLQRRDRHLRRVLFNIAEPGISVWLASQAYYAVSGAPPLSVAPGDLAHLFLPALLLCSVYFALNSGLTALAVWSDTGMAPYAVWRSHFLWVWPNYFAGASIALLVALNTREVSLGSLAAAIPLLGLLHMTFSVLVRRTEDENRHLAELNRIYRVTVEGLAMAIDAKDQTTAGHIRRVQQFTLELARAVGIHDPRALQAVEVASLLHDMGKLAVPDYILNKPGKLDAAEFEQMKQHAAVGADILAAVDFPFPVAPIVRHHHENWDGSGYPDGLRGTDIPLGARILSVIDCYDALTSDRPYRLALPREEAMRIILDRRGTMYDPAIVDAFVALEPHLSSEPHRDGEFAPALQPIRQASSGCTVRQAPSPPSEATTSFAEEILSLWRVAGALPAQVGLQEAVELVVQQIRRMMPASLVVFYERERGTDAIVARHASGPGARSVEGLRFPLGERISGWVAANQTTMINSDPALDLGVLASEVRPGLGSALSVALRANGGDVGALAVYAEGINTFDVAHKQVLEVISTPIALIAQRALAADEESARGWRHEATGLPNARQLARLLSAPGLAADMLPPRFGIAVLRAVGSTSATLDPVLWAASAIRQAVRATDIVFCDDENDFVVLLADCDRETGLTIANRARERFAAACPAEVPATLAAGLALAPGDGDVLPELIELAKRRIRVSCLHDHQPTAVTVHRRSLIA